MGSSWEGMERTLCPSMGVLQGLLEVPEDRVAGTETSRDSSGGTKADSRARPPIRLPVYWQISAVMAPVNPTCFGGGKLGSRYQYWNQTCRPAWSAGSAPDLSQALKSNLK